MSRRIDIELTSTREDGSWTWRAAGAREPKGTLESSILPAGSAVGDVLRVEVEGHLDGMSVVAVVPPRTSRREPERLELRTPRRHEGPLVTTELARRRSSERGRGRGRDGERDRDRDRRDGRDRREGRDGRPRDGRERDGRERDRDEGRQRRRQEGRHERPARPAEPVDAKPKPKRLRPARTHRAALLDAVAAEQRPIVEQLLQGGIPAVRQAIDKQNESLRAEGRPEVRPDSLLKAAEDLRPRALAALWRDRAEAAVAQIDDLDLRDLRSVVNAAGDAGRDEEPRALASQLREALTNRVEKEHAAWLAELSDTLREGRVVRALRLSSRPPKAGAPIPPELATQLVEAASAALTEETGQDRWATVLDALAYSPVRRRVVPQSLPAKLSPALREVVAKLGSRLPEIAHIFAIEPDQSATRTRPARRRGGSGASGGAPGGGGSGGSGAGTATPAEARRARTGADKAPSGRRRARPPADPSTTGPTPAREPETAPQPSADGAPPAGAESTAEAGVGPAAGESDSGPEPAEAGERQSAAATDVPDAGPEAADAGAASAAGQEPEAVAEPSASGPASGESDAGPEAADAGAASAAGQEPEPVAEPSAPGPASGESDAEPAGEPEGGSSTPGADADDAASERPSGDDDTDRGSAATGDNGSPVIEVGSES